MSRDEILAAVRNYAAGGARPASFFTGKDAPVDPNPGAVVERLFDLNQAGGPDQREGVLGQVGGILGRSWRQSPRRLWPTCSCACVAAHHRHRARFYHRRPTVESRKLEIVPEDARSGSPAAHPARASAGEPRQPRRGRRQRHAI